MISSAKNNSWNQPGLNYQRWDSSEVLGVFHYVLSGRTALKQRWFVCVRVCVRVFWDHRVWTVEAPVSVQGQWVVGGFGGCPTVAGRLVEIKQLKIDRHSEEFKDCSEKVFMRGCLKIVCMAALERHKCKKKRTNKKLLSQHITQSLREVRMWWRSSFYHLLLQLLQWFLFSPDAKSPHVPTGEEQ